MIAVTMTYLHKPRPNIVVLVDLSSVRTPIRSYVCMKALFNTSWSIPQYSLHSIYMSIFLQSPQVQPQCQQWDCNLILNLVISWYTPCY